MLVDTEIGKIDGRKYSLYRGAKIISYLSSPDKVTTLEITPGMTVLIKNGTITVDTEEVKDEI